MVKSKIKFFSSNLSKEHYLSLGQIIKFVLVIQLYLMLLLLYNDEKTLANKTTNCTISHNYR